ncbi:MAG: glucosaminidase domain-containing protein [Bacteroidota bacterium]
MDQKTNKRIEIEERPKAYQGTLFQEYRQLKERVFKQTNPTSFVLTLRRVFLFMQKLSVALKYQLHQYLPGAERLPWLKIAAAAALIIIVFRKDLQLKVNLSGNAMEITDEQEENKGQQTRLAAASGFSSLWSDEKEAIDPFRELPGDSPKERAFKSYIRRFKKVAKAEMDKYGIPASIKMGQALLESDAGRSKLASRNNNHFGMKCFSKSCKKGHCSNFSDDHHKDFFRNYESGWESWRAHSKMITTGRYKGLLKHQTDYKAWAKGLKEIGYATDPNYVRKLTNLIEEYQLYLLDQ